MGLVRVVLWGFKCLRCGHPWVPLGLKKVEEGERPPDPKEEPRVCPKCKSPYWNRPRRDEAKK